MATLPFHSLALVAALGTSSFAFAQDTPWLPEARKVASAVPPKLLQVLGDQITQGGLASAVTVCNEKAPQMAKTASEQTGWAIRRVSLKNRNPKAVPDAWEREALEEFDRRAAAGEDVSKLEKFATVDVDGRPSYRYMKALPTQQLCLSCHGSRDAMPADVADKLHALYPNDQATGYALGQVRGALTIRKPVP